MNFKGMLFLMPPIKSYRNLRTRFKVVAILVNMVFALPYLTYSQANTLQHLELFAGDCSVTRAEVAETRLNNAASES